MRLYVIGSTNPRSGEAGPSKFGISRNPKRRLRELQQGGPFKLKLVWSGEFIGVSAGEVERVLKHFFCLQTTNGEWVNCLPDKLMERIDEAAQEAARRSKLKASKAFNRKSLMGNSHERSIGERGHDEPR